MEGNGFEMACCAPPTAEDWAKTAERWAANADGAATALADDKPQLADALWDLNEGLLRMASFLRQQQSDNVDVVVIFGAPDAPEDGLEG